MKRSLLSDCTIIELPKVHFKAGNMSVADGIKELPFKVSRAFWIYDIPAGESRGAHAHRECHQFIIAGSGSFEVEADDGREKRTFFLNRPFYGLHIPPGIWAHELNFSAGAICIVLTSHPYDDDDYIKDYDEFRRAVLRDGE
ncbi:MAG: FdtA/QdtA family cupin domain-containing protein [Bacteroidales bacterium]